MLAIVRVACVCASRLSCFIFCLTLLQIFKVQVGSKNNVCGYTYLIPAGFKKLKKLRTSRLEGEGTQLDW
jgi:hypothetical protein